MSIVAAQFVRRGMQGVWKRVADAAAATRFARHSGILSSVQPTQLVKWSTFERLATLTQAALITGVGPHLAVWFHAANTPDNECLVEYRDGNDNAPRRWTWRQFDAACNQLGHALVARGVRAGDGVALMLPNGSEVLIAQQALARIGATSVLIGYRLKAGEIAHILGNAEPRATIIHHEFLAVMRDARALAKNDGPLIVAGGDDSLVDDCLPWNRVLAAERGDISPKLPPVRDRSGEQGPGTIVYTSGTTGKPKGARRSWNQTGFDSAVDMMSQLGIRTDDRHLAVCPLYHSAGPAFVAITMALGGTTVLLDNFDAEAALAVIAREGITSSMMVPTMLSRMAALPDNVRDHYDVSSLRWVLSGAAPLPTETARRFQAAFGHVLWNFYGATETGLVTLAAPTDHAAHPGTIGRILRGNEIRLLDATGNEVADGEIGELYVRNSTLIEGYHRDVEATSSSMRDGFFSVGDLARRDADGFYYLESRTHDLVISGGVNIYPREIEDVLHTHPAIVEAAVVGEPSEQWGESLVAYVVLRPGMTLSQDDVIAYCRAALADYKRPRRVVFLRELPRNPTGKILKRELRS